MTTIWDPTAGASTVNANNSLKFQTFTATAGQTDFTLTEFSYIPGTGSTLLVYNGSIQVPIQEYAEVSSTLVRTNFSCNEGDTITVLGYVGTSATVEGIRLFNNNVVAVAGQTQIPVSATYDAGTSSTLVFKNGAALIPAIDYIESDKTNYITLVTPATAGDKIFSVVGQLVNDVGSDAELISFDGQTVADALNTAKTLTDYTALRAYTGSATKVTITGVLATAQPQGIYGDFSYDSTDTTSAGNGITTIVDALGRRWKRQFSGFINILWADITIGVDASSKLQAAVSIGDCLIPADVVLTISSEVTVPNNVNFRIDGEITGSGRLTCSGTSEIFGSGKVTCGNIWCISVAAGNPVVTGLYISKSSCYGVYISPTANIDSLQIQNNQITGCQYGILRNGGTSFTTKNVSITGNVIQNSTGDGIEWNVGPNDKKILIDSNIVTETNGTVANSGIGIGVAGSSYTNNNDLTNYVQQVTITNNHVSGARQGIHTETTAKCKISNNHIENITSAYGDASIAISGILCYAPVDTEISNNQIDNNGGGISVDFGVVASVYTGSPFNTTVSDNKLINSGNITVKAGQHLTMTDENVMIVKGNKVIGGNVTVSGTVNWFIDGNVTRPSAGSLGFSFDFNNSSRGAAYQQQYGQVYSITNNYTKDKIGRVNVSVANISCSYFGNISLNANGNNFAIPASQVVDHEVTRIVYTDVTGFPFGIEYQAGTMVVDKTTPARYLVTVSGSLNRGTDTYSVFDAVNGIVQSTNYAWTTVNNHQLGQAITLSDGTNTKSGYVKQVYINSGAYRMIVCDSSGVALNLGTLGSGTITATNLVTYVSI